MKMFHLDLHCHVKQAHFHMNSFALRLVLKLKWAIEMSSKVYEGIHRFGVAKLVGLQYLGWLNKGGNHCIVTFG